MKKIQILFVILVALVFASSCVSTGIKGTGVNMTTSKPTIIDYASASTGSDIPGWVLRAAEGDYSRVTKDLGLKDRKVFIVSNSGPNKTFLQQWTDLVSIETEVAGQIQRTVAQSIQASEWANQVNDETEINSTIDMYAASLKNVTLTGLEKEASYWILTQRLKPGVKRAKVASDYIEQYTYFVVYSMDKQFFDDQIDVAMAKIEENTDQAKFLREHVTQKLKANVTGGESISQKPTE